MCVCVCIHNKYTHLYIYVCVCVCVCRDIDIDMSFPGGSDSKEFACSVRDSSLIHGYGRSLEKGSSEVATYSSILAWRIPRTEKPGGL